MLEKKNFKKTQERDYDHLNKKSDTAACGLDSVEFSRKNEKLFEGLGEIKEENVVSIICERMENTFTKREISFLLAKQSLTLMMINEKKSENKK